MIQESYSVRSDDSGYIRIVIVVVDRVEFRKVGIGILRIGGWDCRLYTYDDADEEECVDLGGRSKDNTRK